MKEKTSATGLEIAVIGMAGSFPGATNIDKFWDNLKNGVETLAFFTDNELEEDTLYSSNLENSNFVRCKGIVDDIEFFDESFFDFTPIEAQVIDPQIRVFLGIASEALEHAGYAEDNYPGRIGIYSGTNVSLYWNVQVFLKNFDLSGILKGVLSAKDYISMLTSYKLNLKGPSMSVFSACSTSLLAIDLAFRALLTGECDMALAGGITLSLPQKKGYIYQEGMLLSRDGHCRTFDAKASGTIFGQGAGVVVLKPLEQAIADQDYIWAVIKGCAASNDGNEKVGVTAPTVDGQIAAAQGALNLAEIEPESISYMEAHGTGTILGDPIEIEGLTRAFNTKKKGFCRIGSVKTNVGHLDCAAGIAGFIKTVLALKHRLIPPSLHFETPNPKIDFENSPFVVNTEPVEWKNNKYPLRAGVNSLGIGGTNVHVVLEEAPEIDVNTKTRKARTRKLILLSAKTRSALHIMTENFVQYLKKNQGINFSDAVYTLQVGRKVFAHKKMLVCSTADEAIDALTSPNEKNLHASFSKNDNRPVVFLFSGQGSQYVNMGLELYKKEPVFRAEMDRCFEILKPLVDYDIKEILYPGEITNIQKHENITGKDIEEPPASSDQINQTEITQPVLFIFEYALAKLLMKWGISPYAMIGHSIGEYVAACLSGVFSLEEALEIVVLRGKLMQEMPGGAMLSVSTSESELTPLLNENEDISLAAVNGSSYCVVSGPYEAIDNFSKELEKKGIKNKALYTSHAFHSKMMDPVLERFEEKLKTVTFDRPELPYISNLTGNWITVEDAVSPQYWSKHLRQTVRFNDGLVELLIEENAIFVEVGPGRVLSTFVTQHPDKKTSHSILNLVRHPKENIADDKYLLEKIGQLWLFGKKIDWNAFYQGEQRMRIPLPAYPFEKKRYWFDENPFKIAQQLLTSREFRKNPDISQWFYVPSWKRSTLPVRPKNSELSRFLLFTDELGIGSHLLKQLEQLDIDVIIVKKGEVFSRKDNQIFYINPGKSEDFELLFNHLRKEKRMPGSIVHLWNVEKDESETAELTMEKVEKAQVLGYYSLLNLARAIGRENFSDKFKIIVIANNMFDVLGEEKISPEKATLIGPVKNIAREYPEITCRCVDFILPITDTRTNNWEKLIDQLYREITIDSPDGIPDQLIALRNNNRWVQVFEQVLWEEYQENPRLKTKGVYLITGGLGGIGYATAEYLARAVKAKLILIGRTPLPNRDEWENWLNSHDDKDPISDKIKKILELEKLGAEVMVGSANIADAEQIREIITRAQKRFGHIHGVIHSAGIIDYGGIIQRRTPEDSERVLESKVQGTVVLDRSINDVEPDFFILFSSQNSILGPYGEVAYTASNAFLDAFAHYKGRGKNHDTFTAVVNWDLWLEVGMIEAFQERARSDNQFKSQVKTVNHPLIHSCTVSNPEVEIYESTFRLSDYWVMNEHIIMGNPVLVGTSYLEMARAAFEHHAGPGPLEIRSIHFLNPLLAVENKNVQFRMVLKKKEDVFEFAFMSRIDQRGKWRAHAHGEMLSIKNEPPQKYSIEEIKTRCNEEEIVLPRDKFKPFSGFVGTSQRWNCLKRKFMGKTQVLGELELPEEYKDDINTYSIHPAILDVATSFPMGIALQNINDNYLPSSYKKLRIKGALPRKIFCYARYIENQQSQEDKLKIKFNITIMDETGTELLDIEEFTFLSVSKQGQAEAIKERNKFSLSPFLDSIDNDNQEIAERNIIYTDFSNRYALTTSEGVEAFLRILSGTHNQVIVSTTDFFDRLAWARNPPKLRSDSKDKTLSLRPELETTFVTPRNETEEILASIFVKYLAIADIGVHDNLFELGLDSLKAVEISAEISKQFNVNISVGEIFNFPTIEEIANCIGNKKEEEKEEIKINSHQNSAVINTKS
jgi:acyl transferase domain-containing protein/acyl carrier protein